MLPLSAAVMFTVVLLCTTVDCGFLQSKNAAAYYRFSRICRILSQKNPAHLPSIAVREAAVLTYYALPSRSELNAAIKAAHAGESGKGFVVVAEGGGYKQKRYFGFAKILYQMEENGRNR